MLLGVLLLAISAAHSADVEVRLTGGSVTGTVRGQGTAAVQAQVVNRGASALKGVRLGVYYSTLDAPPGPDAAWREHEFVFEPPLPPGEATTLNFTDENAAEYIALSVRFALFADGGQTAAQPTPAGETNPDAGGAPAPPDAKPADAKPADSKPADAKPAPQPEPQPPPKPKPAQVTPGAAAGATVLYRGLPVAAASPLVEQDGALYISTRDLMDNTGGSLGYDSATYEVTLERKGRKLAVKTGERRATADGAAIELAHPVLEIDGRSYLPLVECAAYLGLTATASGKTITLEDAA